jgi:ABC-type microcin C transport system permease subunit YejE
LEILHYVQDDVIILGHVIPNAMKDLLNVVPCLDLEIFHYVQDDVIILGHVIPNAMRDLLNVVLCLDLEILHCVQDDENSKIIDKLLFI